MFLETYNGTVVAVTHDRYFMQSTQWILELDRGNGTPYEGNYSTYLEKKTKRLEQEEKQESSRRKLLSSELEWVRSSPKARQTKSKARLDRYEELVSQNNEALSKKFSKMDRMYIPPGRPLGNVVVDIENGKKVFEDRVLFENLTFSLPPGGIVGVVGANGTGRLQTSFASLSCIPHSSNWFR